MIISSLFCYLFAYLLVQLNADQFTFPPFTGAFAVTQRAINALSYPLPPAIFYLFTLITGRYNDNLKQGTVFNMLHGGGDDDYDDYEEGEGDGEDLEY